MIKEDFVLARIYKTVEEELKQAGINISPENIRNVHNVQSEIVRLGIEGCDEIVMPYFGTFKIKKKTKFMYNLHKENNIESNLTKRIDQPLKRIIFKK